MSITPETGAPADHVPPQLVPGPRSDPIPATFAQQRLWFMAQLDGGSAACHVPLRFRLRGHLDTVTLARALDRLLERHEALQTRFKEVDQNIFQVIDKTDTRFFLRQYDLRNRNVADADAEVYSLLEKEEGAPFDLRRGPLVRGCLVALEENHHILMIVAHHIVIDGWSVSVILRELGVLYAAFLSGASDPLPLPLIQYADYAAWQRRWRTKELLRKHDAYWRHALQGWPQQLSLPTTYIQPQRDFAGDVMPLELTAEWVTELRALGRRYGVTLYTLVLTAWSVVLCRLSGQDDVVIGTPTANRAQRPVQDVVGFFVNLLPLRIRLSGNPTLEELLLRTKSAVLGGLGHPHLPFEQVVEAVAQVRNAPLPLLFRVMLAWQNLGIKPPGLVGLEIAEMPSPKPSAKFDLMLEINDLGDRVIGGLIYATALFDARAAQLHVEWLLRVLKQLPAGMTVPVAQVDLTGASPVDPSHSACGTAPLRPVAS
jgi:Condensation domain